MDETEDQQDPRAILSFLQDQPADEDKFGAHSCIADAIISSIERQASIRLIGLLGRWGTGKSTIISQLSVKIKSKYNDKYVLFTYDTWAHQGDPARRSILEELIYRLTALRLTTLRRWYKTLLTISGSTEKSSTRTKPNISGWGKIVLGMLLLLPIFAVVIDGDTIRLVFSDNPDWISRSLIQAFFWYIILFGIVVALSYVFTLDWRALIESDGSLPSRVRTLLRSGEGIFSHLFTRTFPATSSTTLRQSQPTAIEFRRYLRKIVQNQRPRRIIFVIDNLDRIKPAEALDVWSIMVGMATEEAHRIEADIEPVVILPFDPVALEKIAPGEAADNQAVSDLIEKSFDVTFEVPPPVLSNWRKYFGDQYSDAGLLAWTSNSSFEQYWTVRHFEKLLGSGRVTPRKINRFLNRIVSLAQQQAENLGPAVLSYYIANEADIQNDCLAFLKRNKPAFDQTNGWQRKVAAIAFGTSEKEAAQVLLGDELHEALSARDRDAFQGLTPVNGFEDVVRQFVEDPPLKADGKVDLRPLNALAAYAVGDLSDDVVLWARLWDTWSRASPLEDEDTLSGEAISGFMTVTPDLVISEATLVASRLLDQIRLSSSTERQTKLVAVGDRLLETIGDQAKLELNIGTNVELLLSVLSAATKNSAFASSLRSRSSYENLADAVLSRIKGPAPSLAVANFDTIDKRTTDQVSGDKQAFFDRIGAGLKEIIENVESPDNSIVAAATILSSRHGEKPRYGDVVAALEAEGALSEAVQRALENSADAVVSMVTALRLTFRNMPSAAEVTSLTAWLAKNENAGRLLGSIRRINEGSFLPTFRYLETDGHNVEGIFHPLLIEAIRKGDIGRRGYPDWLLNIFGKLTGWLSEAELRSYASLVSTWTAFQTEVQKLSDDRFLAFISRLPSDKEEDLLAQRIKAFDAKRLSKMVRTGDDIWQAFVRIRPSIGDNHNAKSELFKGLQGVFDGSDGEIGKRVFDRAMKLSELLVPAARKDVVKVAVEGAVASSRTKDFLFLATVEPFKSYVTKPAIAAPVIARLFSDLVRTRDGQKFVERNASSLSRLSSEESSSLKGLLARKRKSKDARTSDWAEYVLKHADLTD